MLKMQVASLEQEEFENMWSLAEKAILRLSSKMNMDIEDKKKKLDVLKNKQLDSVTGKLTNNKDHSGSSQPILSVQDEQESEQMSQEYSCLYDGRLIELTESTVRNLRNENTDEIGKGSFGKVYGSGRPSKRFGMDVVVKKIPLDNGQEKSVKREMIASRIVHPFILPLLAASMVQQCDGRKEFWFVTPRCRNGDLFTVLKEYRENKDARVKLNAVKRVKIIFQLALAIKYIHTAVRGVRYQ
ncbi:uncharacterized protein LOC132716459 isoform X2 [Ruditapes philippinarum]|uniref:uncharacterized protein LOC132716459 isoform X2 n=1 Tax=Ruditapes philippinarum TaxID=129788 RepID=UPI00295BFA16|nr:uncharacterized protein LOC132716459 isoform X2 [Ruditapes philippinarum]